MNQHFAQEALHGSHIKPSGVFYRTRIEAESITISEAYTTTKARA